MNRTQRAVPGLTVVTVGTDWDVWTTGEGEVFGELCGRGAEWRFPAVGQGYAQGPSGGPSKTGVDVGPLGPPAGAVVQSARSPLITSRRIRSSGSCAGGTGRLTRT